MDKYIKIYDDVIDADSCNLLIGKFESAEEDQYEKVRQAERDKAIAFTQINLANNADWTSVQNGMLEVFQDYIMHYINDCNIQPKQWPQTYGYEAIRMKRYLNNDYDRFDPHVDVLNSETSKRFLAFFVYLNNVDEGGETEFVQLTKPGTHIPLKIKAQQGRLLMFPPQWMYYHAGLKPVSNPKYLIHSYCHYD